MSGFVFEKHSDHCSLEFTDALFRMTWDQAEGATRRATELIGESNLSNVLVMAPSLTGFPDGLLACLLRIWKSLNKDTRHFVFITQSETLKEELSASGLLRHWKVMPTRDAALKFLNLEDTCEFDVSDIPQRGSKDLTPMGAEKGSGTAAEPFAIEENDRYCAIHCHPVLEALSWSDLEAASTVVISRFELASTPNLMVDLSMLKYIHSGVVAGLVRLWKASQSKGGQFSVVCPNENVSSVLKTSGLAKVWSIADDREEAAYALGVSRSATAEKRERNLLVAVSLPFSIIAALTLIPMLLKRETLWGVNSQLTALLMSSAALSTGLIALIKEDGLRRKLSAGSVLVSLVVLSTLWFRDNPISFRKQFPDYSFQRESNDSGATEPASETPKP